MEALQLEHDSLTHRIAGLSATLARRRADLALSRAEAATIALSLESSKRALDLALRIEASQPNLRHLGHIPSLRAQLSATRDALSVAHVQRDSLLHQLDPDNHSTHGSPTIVTKKHAPESHPLQVVLRDAVHTNSSFRSDHARIWRDVTMPNLLLLSARLPQAPIHPGVVIERIFQGVTSFVPSLPQHSSSSPSSSSPSANDMPIAKVYTPFIPSHPLASRILSLFAVIHLRSLSPDHPHAIRVFAPRPALSRLTHLLSDPVLSRPSSTLAPLATKQPVHSPPTSVSTPPATSPSSSPPLNINKSHPSNVLSDVQFAALISDAVPARFQASTLSLLYSTDLHGMSLRTLYNRVQAASPTLILINDVSSNVFGCYAAHPWRSSATRYYGTGESFVFGASSQGVIHTFKWSRSNSFFQFTSNTFLAIGGGTGSHFALWVDEDLLMGTTSACSTFHSPPLTHLLEGPASTHCREFKILSMEVWGFGPHLLK